MNRAKIFSRKIQKLILADTLDEKKVKLQEKKEQAKINHEERKLNLKESYTDKKISKHFEIAIKKSIKLKMMLKRILLNYLMQLIKKF